MVKRLASRLTRRHFLLGAGYLPIVQAGYFAGNRLPSGLSAADAQRTRVIEGRYLGLRPDSRKDQTRAFLRALNEAAKRKAWIRLVDGIYVIGELESRFPVRLMGSGRTRILCRRGARFMMYLEDETVSLKNLILDGNEQGYDQDPLIQVEECPRLSVKACTFQSFDGTGLVAEKCSGIISHSRFRNLTDAAIHSQDSRALKITENAIHDCGNNGILIWQGTKRSDGAVVRGNEIANINNRSGGDGPYGNGINIFRAGQVTVEGNRISRCAYSAIRNNSGDDCKILDNSCDDIGEVAIFVEFAWRNALVRNNRIRNASAGISATNMDHGGRNAIIEKNVIENVRPRIRSVDVLGYGISAEADTVIRNNVVRKASDCGLTLGWGPYLKNVTATKNIIEDCTYGIGVSVVEGAGRATITHNTIARALRGNIVGLNYARPVTGDFLRGARPPRHVVLEGNIVRM